MTTKVGTPGGGRWIIAETGMGGFLDPPGAPTHHYSVHEYRGSRSREAESMLSVLTAVDADYVPAAIRRAARRLIDNAPIQCTENWLRDVYRYFRHCYSPDGIDRNVQRCIIDHNDAWPPERHLAVLAVREWFPDHEPRTDLIASP